jgi:flagellar protein FliS
MANTDLAYRQFAAAGASGIGLLISLYDTLAGDLRRAADAQRRKNIEQRSREAAHALLVIGHLEHWLTQGEPGELTSRLAAFYVKLRRDLLEGEAKQSAELIEQAMNDVLRVCAFWQQMEAGANTEAHPVAQFEMIHASYAGGQATRIENSWSA